MKDLTLQEFLAEVRALDCSTCRGTGLVAGRGSLLGIVSCPFVNCPTCGGTGFPPREAETT